MILALMMGDFVSSVCMTWWKWPLTLEYRLWCVRKCGVCSGQHCCRLIITCSITLSNCAGRIQMLLCKLLWGWHINEHLSCLLWKYRVIHVTPSFLPEWSEVDETCFRSIASSCRYCAWVICSGLKRWGWVALVTARVLAALCCGNSMSYFVAASIARLEISDYFFWDCLEE